MKRAKLDILVCVNCPYRAFLQMYNYPNYPDRVSVCTNVTKDQKSMRIIDKDTEKAFPDWCPLEDLVDG